MEQRFRRRTDSRTADALARRVCQISPSEFQDALFDEYVKVLASKRGTGYFFHGDPEPEEIQRIARMMLNAIDMGINNGYRRDYLGRNQALKEACEKFGIYTSPEFRLAWIRGIVVV